MHQDNGNDQYSILDSITIYNGEDPETSHMDIRADDTIGEQKCD